MTFMNGLLALGGSSDGGGSLKYGNVLIKPDERLFASPSVFEPVKSSHSYEQF